MGIPIRYVAKIGGYILKQHLTGRKRYPLVMMMEPLFRCNLACAGCGKIDYPDEILNKRLPVDEALESVRECGAPVVVIAGGEPLLHKDLPQIVQGIIAQKKFAIVCTNALLLEKKIKDYKPSPYFTWSIHLDGDKEMHDGSVCQRGVYDKAVAAIAKAKEMGFRVTINCTFFNNAKPEKIADFFDSVTKMGIDGITISHGPIAALKWPSMTMGFGKPNAKAFADVKPGETIRFEFKKGGAMDYELVSVQRLGGAK